MQEGDRLRLTSFVCEALGHPVGAVRWVVRGEKI